MCFFTSHVPMTKFGPFPTITLMNDDDDDDDDDDDENLAERTGQSRF